VVIRTGWRIEEAGRGWHDRRHQLLLLTGRRR
jgi:hypothetical protein